MDLIKHLPKCLELQAMSNFICHEGSLDDSHSSDCKENRVSKLFSIFIYLHVLNNVRCDKFKSTRQHFHFSKKDIDHTKLKYDTGVQTEVKV